MTRRHDALAVIGFGVLAVVHGGCVRSTMAPPAPARELSTRTCETIRSDEPCVYQISLIELIAAPNEWHGKRVQVVGFMHLEFEGTAIYLSREDRKEFIAKNGLWLSFREDVYDQAENLNDQYVFIRGTFVADKHGHLGLWSGTLDDIDQVFALR